jgi:hypothetical protein
MIAEADHNHDHVINCEEFIRLMLSTSGDRRVTAPSIHRLARPASVIRYILALLYHTTTTNSSVYMHCSVVLSMQPELSVQCIMYYKHSHIVYCEKSTTTLHACCIPSAYSVMIAVHLQL